jgi:hypothetical protein
MFDSVPRQLSIPTVGSLTISSLVSLHVQSEHHLFGGRARTRCVVRIPRSWGSLGDLPSPLSSYCTDSSGAERDLGCNNCRFIMRLG